MFWDGLNILASFYVVLCIMVGVFGGDAVMLLRMETDYPMNVVIEKDQGDFLRTKQGSVFMPGGFYPATGFLIGLVDPNIIMPK